MSRLSLRLSRVCKYEIRLKTKYLLNVRLPPILVTIYSPKHSFTNIIIIILVTKNHNADVPYRLLLCLFLFDLNLLDVYSRSSLYLELPELDFDEDGDGVESSSDTGGEKADPRRWDLVTLPYPNLRDAEPLRISEKAISGEEVSQLGPRNRGISHTYHSI